MQKNNKRIGPVSILKWDDKIVQVWFYKSKDEKLSESERELYFWLAIFRNNIYRLITHNGRSSFMFWKNDIETKTTSNQTIKFYPSSPIGSSRMDVKL